MSETTNQAAIRAALTAQGYRLWRNNRGALRDKRGVPVRYGLGNDSDALDKVLKSSDLIGWRPVVVTPDMVGQTVALFVTIEAKPDGWTMPVYARDTDYAHAAAQKRWIDMVVREGGEGGFMIDPVRGYEQI